MLLNRISQRPILGYSAPEHLQRRPMPILLVKLLHQPPLLRRLRQRLNVGVQLRQRRLRGIRLVLFGGQLVVDKTKYRVRGQIVTDRLVDASRRGQNLPPLALRIVSLYVHGEFLWYFEQVRAVAYHEGDDPRQSLRGDV